MNNYNNYMINSVSELYHLRLENISLTVTLDWWLQDSTSSLFSWFSSSLGSPLFLQKLLNLICVCLLFFFIYLADFLLNTTYSWLFLKQPLQVYLF